MRILTILVSWGILLFNLRVFAERSVGFSQTVITNCDRSMQGQGLDLIVVNPSSHPQLITLKTYTQYVKDSGARVVVTKPVCDTINGYNLAPGASVVFQCGVNSSDMPLNNSTISVFGTIQVTDSQGGNQGYVTSSGNLYACFNGGEVSATTPGVIPPALKNYPFSINSGRPF